MHLDRRRFLIGSLGVAGAAALASCTSDDGGGGGGSEPTDGEGAAPSSAADALAAPGSAGLVDEAAFQARATEYLQGATAELDPSGPVSIGAFLVAAHRDPDFTWQPTAVTVDTLQPACPVMNKS